MFLNNNVRYSKSNECSQIIVWDIKCKTNVYEWCCDIFNAKALFINNPVRYWKQKKYS